MGTAIGRAHPGATPRPIGSRRRASNRRSAPRPRRRLRCAPPGPPTDPRVPERTLQQHPAWRQKAEIHFPLTSTKGRCSPHQAGGGSGARCWRRDVPDVIDCRRAPHVPQRAAPRAMGLLVEDVGHRLQPRRGPFSSAASGLVPRGPRSAGRCALQRAQSRSRRSGCRRGAHMSNTNVDHWISFRANCSPVNVMW